MQTRDEMSGTSDRPAGANEVPDAIERAQAFGVDISLLRSNLRFTPAERILRMKRTANSLLALRRSLTVTQTETRGDDGAD